MPPAPTMPMTVDARTFELERVQRECDDVHRNWRSTALRTVWVRPAPAAWAASTGPVLDGVDRLGQELGEHADVENSTNATTPASGPTPIAATTRRARSRSGIADHVEHARDPG